MLKGIPTLLSPDLVKALMEMGHGDTIVLADGNFPGASLAKRLIRMDGVGTAPLLDAILHLMPLDTYVDAPISVMQVVPGDDVQTPIWAAYQSTLETHEPGIRLTQVERFAFYDLAKSAYCIVQTGEMAQYANILLQKGVVLP